MCRSGLARGGGRGEAELAIPPRPIARGPHHSALKARVTHGVLQEAHNGLAVAAQVVGCAWGLGIGDLRQGRPLRTAAPVWRPLRLAHPPRAAAGAATQPSSRAMITARMVPVPRSWGPTSSGGWLSQSHCVSLGAGGAQEWSAGRARRALRAPYARTAPSPRTVRRLKQAVAEYFARCLCVRERRANTLQ